MRWQAYIKILRSRTVPVIACTLLVSLAAAVPAQPQSGVVPGAAPGTPGQSTVAQPERVLERNLVVRGSEFSQLILGDKRYIVSGRTRFLTADGRTISLTDVKPGQVVDVVYLTGGTKTEGHPYRPFDKVLLSVRVVAGVQPR